MHHLHETCVTTTYWTGASINPMVDFSLWGALQQKLYCQEIRL